MWLRQLTTPDAETRRSAFNHLYGSICHQNWNCPATAYAVPYIIEILQQPSVEQKADFLEMLADIASCAPLQEAKWRENKLVPSWNVPTHIPLKDAHEAVAASIPICIALLDDPNAVMRVHAAQVLASFPERCDDLFPLLESALRREPTESGRADITFTLGQLAASSPERWPQFMPMYEQSESELVRFVAALTIVRLAREDTPEPIIQYLGSVAQQAEMPPSLSAFSTLLTTGGDARDAALAFLQLAGREHLGFLIRPLIDRAARLRSTLGNNRRPFTHFDAFNTLVEWLLTTLFDQPSGAASTEPLPASDLNANQRGFLLFVLHHGRWQGKWPNLYFGLRLANSGLPSTPDALAAYLGVPLP